MLRHWTQNFKLRFDGSFFEHTGAEGLIDKILSSFVGSLGDFACDNVEGRWGSYETFCKRGAEFLSGIEPLEYDHGPREVWNLYEQNKLDNA